MPGRQRDNITIPLDLIDAIRKGECVLFAASGLSSKVNRKNGKTLPGWSDFLAELLVWCQQNRVSFNSRPEEIKEMIQKGNFVMAAQELQEMLNTNEFSEFLNSVFRDVNVKPTQTHILLTKIPFRAILTTNYDTLLEGAYAISNDGRLPNKYTQLDVSAAIAPLRKRDIFIFKMHGDIDRTETIVLGGRSYDNLLYKSPDYLSFLEILFTTQTVLFIGFGGSDPDLDYVVNKLSTIFSRTLNKHFLLSPGGKFNFAEKKRLLIDKRLEVIDYKPNDAHSGVDDFVQTLNNIINKISPQIKSIDKYNVLTISVHEDMKIVSRIESHFQSSANINLIGWANMDYYFSVDENVDVNKIIGERDQDRVDLIIMIITEIAMRSKRFEDDIELALLKELEDEVPVMFVVKGNVRIPDRLKNKVYLKISDNITDLELKELEDFIRLLY